MIRRKKDIDFDIKSRRKNLDTRISNSIRSEIAYKEDITFLEEELSKLKKEVCFEDTLEGSIRALEDSAHKEIKEILSKLSVKTGKGYWYIAEPKEE